jgi:hypothetical protein
MILDQGAGAHSNQTQYLGAWWTWLSDESSVVVATAHYTITLRMDHSEEIILEM